MKKKIAVIGSGFSGMSAASYLSKAGNEVHVFEKHSGPGGRARQFSTDQGFVFDMGPSWYWMPDIIESFFADFGYTSNDFFKLISLSPQFEIIFSDQKIEVPKDLSELISVFEGMEKGAGKQLQKFMHDAKFKYTVG